MSTSKDVATRPATALTLTDDQQAFTDTQVAALQQIGVQGASQGDLDVFFHQCRRTGLDPFLKQVYMIARRKRVGRDQYETTQTIQTGIDGFRLIARRAADKRGETLSMDDTIWIGPDGSEHKAWIWPNRPPSAARVTVRIGGGTFSGVAALHEYVQRDRHGNPTGQWRTMPAVMIAKCAEALALRKAFPQDLSGIYTAEEMAQADNQDHQQPAPQSQSRVQQVTREDVEAHQAKQAKQQPAPQPEPEPQPDGVQDAEIMAGEDMLAEIASLLHQIGRPEEVWAMDLRIVLKDGSINALTDLTAEQADTVLSILYKKVAS